jgi:hypothetical protein
MMTPSLLLVGFVTAALAQSEQAREADTRYYMLVFGYQRTPLQPCLTHTFATFVKARGAGAAAEAFKVQTISWMPDDLELRRLRLRPQHGVNLDLPATLRLARSLNTAVAMWGPYEIQPELYERAVRQVARLNEGGLGYKLLDRAFRPYEGSNCIHAVCDLDTANGLTSTGTICGQAAAGVVVRHLARWIIERDQLHDWLIDRLDLGAYPMERRR